MSFCVFSFFQIKSKPPSSGLLVLFCVRGEKKHNKKNHEREKQRIKSVETYRRSAMTWKEENHTVKIFSE